MRRRSGRGAGGSAPGTLGRNVAGSAEGLPARTNARRVPERVPEVRLDIIVSEEDVYIVAEGLD
jgi:hypothetical protein